MLFAAPFLMQASPDADSTGAAAPTKETFVKTDSAVKDSTKHRVFSFATKPIKKRMIAMGLRAKKAKLFVSDSLFAKNEIGAPKHEKIKRNKPAKQHLQDSMHIGTAHRADSIRHKEPADSISYEIHKHAKDSIATETDIEISVFPNPAADYVAVTAKADIQKIEVVNLATRSTVAAADGATEIDLSHLGKGLYLVKVTTDKGSKSVTVLKQ